MNNIKNKKIKVIATSSILMGTMVDARLLILPNKLSEITYEDSWIAVVFGSLFPIIISFSGYYILKFNNKNNIMNITKKYFGEYFGSWVILFILVNYVLLVIYNISAFTSVLEVSIYNVNPLKVIIIIILLSIYGAKKDLNFVSNINIISVIFAIAIYVIGFYVIRSGSYTNLIPILKIDFSSLLKGSYYMLYYYIGIETVLIISDNVQSIKHIKYSIIISIITTLIIYLSIFELSIYYLGCDIISKSQWATLLTSSSIKVSLINDLRLFSIGVWFLVIMKSITNNFYFILKVGSSIINKKYNFIYILSIILITIYFSYIFKNSLLRDEILVPIINKYYIILVFYILYITLRSYMSYRSTRF